LALQAGNLMPPHNRRKADLRLVDRTCPRIVANAAMLLLTNTILDFKIIYR
jgi:hypothetical protein